MSTRNWKFGSSSPGKASREGTEDSREVTAREVTAQLGLKLPSEDTALWAAGHIWLALHRTQPGWGQRNFFVPALCGAPESGTRLCLDVPAFQGGHCKIPAHLSLQGLHSAMPWNNIRRNCCESYPNSQLIEWELEWQVFAQYLPAFCLCCSRHSAIISSGRPAAGAVSCRQEGVSQLFPQSCSPGHSGAHSLSLMWALSA